MPSVIAKIEWEIPVAPLCLMTGVTVYAGKKRIFANEFSIKVRKGFIFGGMQARRGHLLL